MAPRKIPTRTWETNADEFGALTRQGYGVRLAVLAACSVQDAGKGRPAGNAEPGNKTTQDAFAKKAGVARSTVGAYLDKWDRMPKRLRIPRTRLTPDMVDTLPISDEFVEAFEDLTTGSASGLTGKAGDITKNKQAMKQAILGDERTAEAAEEALYERHRRSRLPEAPFDTPPQIGDPVIEAIMDGAALLGRLDTQISQVRNHSKANPEAWNRKTVPLGTSLCDDLAGHIETLRAILDATRGLSDEDLDRLRGGV